MLRRARPYLIGALVALASISAAYAIETYLTIRQTQLKEATNGPN